MTYKYFGAPWCAPCAPVLAAVEEIAQRVGDQVEAYSVMEEAGQQEAVRFRVSSIPTLIIMQGDIPIRSMCGQGIPRALRRFLWENGRSQLRI